MATDIYIFIYIYIYPPLGLVPEGSVRMPMSEDLMGGWLEFLKDPPPRLEVC